MFFMPPMSLGLTRYSRAGGSGIPFDPSILFSNGERGAWYDPSDLGSMFQDASGTIPAAYGQPVGLILDKSGNGNHASQATATARPTLGRMPVGGRRNLIVSSEDLTTPVWGSVVSPDTFAQLEPDGFTRVSFTAVSSDRRLPRHQNGVFSGITTGEVRYIRGLFRPGPGITTIALGAGSFAQFTQAAYNIQTGLTTVYTLSNPGTTIVETAEEVSPGVWELVVKYTAGVSPLSSVSAHFGVGTAQDLRTNSPVGYCDIGFVQAELTPSPYQRVGSSGFDVTEDGVQTLTYLDFDGVDDVLTKPWTLGWTAPAEVHWLGQSNGASGAGIGGLGIQYQTTATRFGTLVSSNWSFGVPTASNRETLLLSDGNMSAVAVRGGSATDDLMVAYRDGAVLGSQVPGVALGTAQSGTLRIGDAAYQSRFYGGVMIFRELTPAERAQLVDYFYGASV